MYYRVSGIASHTINKGYHPTEAVWTIAFAKGGEKEIIS